MPLPLTMLLSLVMLFLGAELLVRGASRLALILRISPVVVGLTVVAYGTSTPELGVNIVSVFEGNLDLAVGNVVGSNILNVFFILGLSAIIAPLVVHRQLIRLDVPIMIGVSLLLWILAIDGRLSFFDGLILLSGILLYTVFLIRLGRQEASSTSRETDPSTTKQVSHNSKTILISALMVLAGLGLLMLGSHWLVEGAVALAQLMGVSEMVIGLTVVAAGTSLPEVITSLVAVIRGQRDIAVGNVVGSNIYNILAILGLTSVIAKHGVPISPSTLGFDIPVMIGAAFACLPIFFTGHRIARWEGFLFLVLALAYNTYLILKATQHDHLPLFNGVMLSFVIPLIFVTLMIFFIRSLTTQTHKSGV